MPRHPDWETDLNNYLAEAAGTPYAYGHNDCMFFVFKAVDALTGQDFWSEHEGKYDSEATSKTYLESIGFNNIYACIDDKLERKKLPFAQRGDIVAINTGTVAICYGATALAIGEDEATGATVLVSFARDTWRKAWSV